MRYPLAVAFLTLPALAQSNAVPGTDVMAYDVVNCQVYGRTGAAYPNGTVVVNIGHSMCNSGTTFIPWTGGSTSVQMLSTYPKIATLIAREANGRMSQVSGLSHCKHSRTAFNFASGPCAPCQTGPSQTWRVGCSDTYSSGFSSLGNLGPTTEIDPWTGLWNPVGSYFDRGDPEVAAPANNDGALSSITGDSLKNRMQLPETMVAEGGTFWGQAYISVQGEPGANRANNAAVRQVTFTWNGTSWVGGVTGSPTTAPVLTKWTGATTAIGSNGSDDGRFMVGCKVTGPVAGIYHYEIAVHNLDNAGGGGSLRVPVCASSQVLNAGFKDIDGNALNQWTFSRTTNEIAWQAAAGNAIEWNSLYNFWFDTDAAPVPGTVSIDRARPGPGALTVSVGAQVPGLAGNEFLGAGCGSPVPGLIAPSSPDIPNAAYALTVQGQPFSITTLLVATAQSGATIGSCTVWPDPNQAIVFDFVLSDISGVATWPLPIPPTLLPMDAWCQGGQYVGGPFLDGWTLTNAIKAHVGQTGCP